ncbi:hypothetical protein BC829DRAFT_417282 [Chytridium lagenaria]|nr:hypothetical protein BC829DRAFT_417282 [Chytridium lagenaria]
MPQEQRRQQRCATSGPGFMDEYKPVTGKMAADGLNRYDLDFLETVDWVNKLLLRLEEDGIKHVTKMATEAPAKPVELPQALVFTYTNRYTYDFTTKPPTEADVVVTLKVHVGSLGLTPEERHKFLLLTQNLYDPYQDVVTIKPQKNVDYSGDSHAKKRLRLIQVLDTFLNDAKSSTDKFTDVPLDLRRVKARRAHLAFLSNGKSLASRQKPKPPNKTFRHACSLPFSVVLLGSSGWKASSIRLIHPDDFFYHNASLSSLAFWSFKSGPRHKL